MSDKLIYCISIFIETVVMTSTTSPSPIMRPTVTPSVHTNTPSNTSPCSSVARKGIISMMGIITITGMYVRVRAFH